MTSWSPSEAQGRTPHLRVAVHHPEALWVDILTSVLTAQEGVEVVEAHTDLGWVDHAVRSGWADVVLVSADVPPPALHETLTALRNATARVPVVALGPPPHPDLLLNAVRSGVRGWVHPEDATTRLVETLRAVAHGETRLPAAPLTTVLDTLTGAEESREAVDAALSMLSSREIDILCCLAQGMSRKEIAERYVLSPHTVRTHINNLMRKLKVHSTLGAVSLARQSGLLESRRAPP